MDEACGMACPARLERISATLAERGMSAGSGLGAYGVGDSGDGDAGVVGARASPARVRGDAGRQCVSRRGDDGSGK